MSTPMPKNISHIKGAANGAGMGGADDNWSHKCETVLEGRPKPVDAKSQAKTNSEMKALGGASLTMEQRHEIGKIARTNKHPGLEGINITHVARRFHVTPKAAKKWLLQGLEQHPNYADKPRPGRPPTLKQQQKNNVRRHAVHRDSCSKIQEWLHRAHGIDVSRNTVARVLGSGRNPLRWRAITRGKVLNPANIPKRLLFCMQHLHDDFRRYVYLDQFDDYAAYEKDGSATHCWQGDRAPPAAQLGKPYTFRMYAAVGYNFKSPLLFVAPSPAEGTREHKSKVTFNAKGYIDMMKALKPYLDKRYPDRDYVIIQDHAPQHKAKVSKEAVEQMGLPILTDYTPQSWDQNIIENVWGMFRNELTGKKAKCTDGWYAAYRAAWGEVKQGSINQLVDGMQARMESIIDAKGMWVSHH